MFQVSLFTESGRLCNPFDYMLGFTCLLMLAHFLFLLRSLRERRRIKLYCLGGATLVLLAHSAAAALAWEFSMAFEVGSAPGFLGRLGNLTWLFLPLLYLAMIPLALLRPGGPPPAKSQDSVPDKRTV